MLINKYLPSYHFNEIHTVEINGLATGIYEKILACDFSKSLLIRFLFTVRGISTKACTINDVTGMGFTKLDEEPGKEILFGMVTDSPMFNSCRAVSSKDFIQMEDADIIKAVINFRLQNRSNSQHIISTETRIWCGSNAIKSGFRYYWFFIKPFSNLIRRAILKQIEKQVRSKKSHK